MKFILVCLTMIMSLNTFAIECDCEVRVFSPLNGSHKMEPVSLKTYTLEEFSSYSVQNQNDCRASCLKQFEKDMPTERLNALLVTLGQNLINEKALGYNCTGLTTMRFPVRVRATLGFMGLGNVSSLVQVVSHEEVCF